MIERKPNVNGIKINVVIIIVSLRGNTINQQCIGIITCQ